MVCPEAITEKRQQVAAVLTDLQAVLFSIQMGGLDAPVLKKEIAMQEARVALLDDLAVLDEAGIRARLTTYAAVLGPQADILLRTPYAIGFPPPLLRAKILGELCLIALGEHPSQGLGT